MTVDPKYVELINAALDGETSDIENEDLARYLAGNPEAQQMHDDLAQLCDGLNAVEEIEPPSHLRYAILESMKSNLRPTSRDSSSELVLWRQIIAMPMLRHAVAFAAGVFMTFALINSNKISNQAFDDVTGLVGTISDTAPAGSGYNSINITTSDIAGTVSIHKSGSLTVVEFDLVANGAVEIVAGFPERDLWFKGFAQLENDGATVHAESGIVTMQMRGKNRYAMYLSHGSESNAVINLKFYAAGSLIHEADLALLNSGSEIE